jgi:hypothetical protein
VPIFAVRAHIRFGVIARNEDFLNLKMQKIRGSWAKLFVADISVKQVCNLAFFH